MPFGIDSDQIIGTYESINIAKQGEWIWKPPYMVCSVCGRHSINRYRSKYCQHCGAKMAKKGEKP